MLRKALADAGESVTAADALAAMYTVKDEHLEGLLPNKVTFTKGKAIAFTQHPCVFVVGIKDGKTVAPNGAEPVCPSA